MSFHGRNIFTARSSFSIDELEPVRRWIDSRVLHIWLHLCDSCFATSERTVQSNVLKTDSGAGEKGGFPIGWSFSVNENGTRDGFDCVFVGLGVMAVVDGVSRARVKEVACQGCVGCVTKILLGLAF